MKSQTTLILAFALIFGLHPHSSFAQFEKLKKKVQEKVEEKLDGDNEGRTAKLIAKFEKGQPISTTFDDAIYEADFLGNFEPQEGEYRPLDIQPKAEKCGYKLQSGFYTMNAKSFCLRGYTHGPSKGDGHLYAPMKGKKADFVKSIIEHYAAKPETPQQDVQVLIWAVIAGADMNELGERHAKTLNTLFTTKELLELNAKGWAEGYAQKQFDELKSMVFGKTPAKLQELLDADEKIRTSVKGNKSFQEIEKIAIIAGIAPQDMIREVSKGRWSYHPDGFFVRFFPNGYPQTRIDIYVPYKNAVQTDASGKAIGIDEDAKEPKEVVFNPSGMVASPANRPSQRIGPSPVPVNPSEDYVILFYSYPRTTRIPKSSKNCERKSSLVGHVFIGFSKNGVIEKVKGLSPENEAGEGGEVNAFTDESYLLGFNTKCFAVRVTKKQYFDALAATMGDYFVGTNDCVSYAVKIAETLNLKTSTTSDMIAFPDTYLDYLITNNQTVRIPYHLCEVKSKCPDEVIIAIADTPNQANSLTTAKAKPIKNETGHSTQLEIIGDFTDENMPILDVETLDKRLESGYVYHTVTYGTFKKGTKLSCVAKLKNNGSSILKIVKVDNGCPHCVFVEYPTEGIAPGEVKEIKIGYDTKRVGPFNKGITLHTNETPDRNARHTFYIKGTVEE